MEKVYYIKSTHRGRTTIWKGTMEHLINDVFGYTLECGHSWNNKIPLEPKTGTSLVNALNKSANECNRYYDYYELGTEQEWNNCDSPIITDDCRHLN